MVLRKALWPGLGLALSCACSSTQRDGSCAPSDQDGVAGVQQTVLLSVSDTAYAVGAVGSGSNQPNVTVQNSSLVTLTLTNVGTKPHGLHVACIPTDLSAPCPALSCFPEQANFGPVAAGDHSTVTFTTPAVEGAYRFSSEAIGDSASGAQTELIGPIGQFVVM